MVLVAELAGLGRHRDVLRKGVHSVKVCTYREPVLACARTRALRVCDVMVECLRKGSEHGVVRSG